MENFAFQLLMKVVLIKNSKKNVARHIIENNSLNNKDIENILSYHVGGRECFYPNYYYFLWK